MGNFPCRSPAVIFVQQKKNNANPFFFKGVKQLNRHMEMYGGWIVYQRN